MPPASERMTEVNLNDIRRQARTGYHPGATWALLEHISALEAERDELRDHLSSALQAHADLEGDADKLEALATSRGLAAEAMRAALKVELDWWLEEIGGSVARMPKETADKYLNCEHIQRLRDALAVAPDAQVAAELLAAADAMMLALMACRFPAGDTPVQIDVQADAAIDAYRRARDQSPAIVAPDPPADLLEHYDRLLAAVAWLLEDSWDLTEDPGPGIRADLEAAREARGKAGGTGCTGV